MKAPKEVSQLLRHLSERSKEKPVIKSKKEQVMNSLSEKAFHEIADDKSENEIEEVRGWVEIERRQLKQL